MAGFKICLVPLYAMGPYATEFSFLSLCFLIGKVKLASRCGEDEDNGDKVLDRGSGKEEEVSSGQWTWLERPLGPSQDLFVYCCGCLV